ncbi:regulator of nonsense transcripts 2 [Malaya genurostris]|uniref:regulator of nonsense transcripts 2 n=1 Tax=Malaya genurostris TaxID=325434 RepID=UPI0026F3D7E6|nr:regulator of nonsense transcripts 2 [Malaya genurostris]XP_058442845.1 regulator of nonsense transcripts 2 [Malaya genurostris]
MDGAQNTTECSTGETSVDCLDDQAAKKEILEYIAEIEAKYAQKASLRFQNQAPERPPESHFTKCDSSLKKNTAFVKKLKQFTASQLDGLLKDMSGLNLTKYISEVSAAIVEAKLKMSDVASALILCSKLHQTYADFSASFYDSWQKILHVKAGEKIGNPSKMRVDLRFYGELISVGIFTNKLGLPLLGACLTGLISQDKEEHSNLSIILSFCRHLGDEYAGLIPKRMQESAKKYSLTIPGSTLLPPDKQNNLRNLLKDYYQTLSEHLKNEHRQLQYAEKSKRRMLESKGEVSNDKKEQIEMLQNNYEKLLSFTQTLADLLNESLPELTVEIEMCSTEGNVIESAVDEQFANMDPWGDEDTRNFYVNLPDLRQFLPNYCGKKEELVPDEPAITEEVLDMDVEPEAEDLPDPPVEFSETVDGEDETVTAPNTPHHHANREYFEAFIGNLQNCVNMELIDSAAIDFLLNLNTKNNRKRVVKVLFGVQRTRLDLLPMYGRFVAILNLVSPDVAVDLCQMLKVDFKYQIKKKDQINIETKIKVVRYIGELVKFGIYNKIEALFCLKCLLHNFQHHHIEMTCAFLEVCGVYLYNSRESRLRTNVYLEQMMRLKTNTTMDSRHAQQVETAYYLVKQPEGMRIQRKVRPLVHTYIRHLIFEELNKSNVDKMIRQLRRLNWEDRDTHNYTVKCLSKAYSIRYHLIRSLADLVSGLSSYQEKAVIKVIDAVFEDIRAGLEIHDTKLAQRRIAMAKYLGELYNYRLVESGNVLNTLYSIISLGVSFNHEVPSEVDPPGSLFRLKLVCVLLDTCGQYFTSASSRKRMDYFLIFFQHYYWFKKSDPIFTSDTNNDLFPILIDHMYKECFKNLRQKLKLFTTYDAAKEAVEALRKKLYPNLFNIKDDDDRSLKPIQENESDKEDTVTEDCTSEAFGDSEDDDENPRIQRDDEEVMDDDLEDDDGFTEELETLDKCSPTEKTIEDLEFEKEFERMATESFLERLKEPVKMNTKDIPVPLTMRSSGAKKTYEQLHETKEKQDTVPFVLMVRGKGKQQQYKSFEAPSNSQLAIYLKDQEQKIKEENDSVKRLTLNITERLEEEDYQESLLQSQRSPASSKIRIQKAPKFKHPKGVPDVDAIFH